MPEMETDLLKTQNYSSQIARGRLNFDIVSLFLRLLSISLMRSFTLFVCFVWEMHALESVKKCHEIVQHDSQREI
jgi:hypothetical protein